jgi:hypothetical protein
MLGRALSLATVTLLIGCFAVTAGQAENLEAGKSPSQLFADTCNACHKSPRGLLKTVSVGSLPGFLREHYTTSSDMAKLLSDFLIANGANDKRNAGTQPKQAKDAKPDGKPDTDGLSPQGEPGRQGRNARRLAPPEEVPEGVRPAADGQAPAQAAIERGQDGRKLSAKQKLTKKGRPGSEELPKAELDKPDVARDEPSKGEPSKGEPMKDLSKIEAPKEGVSPKEDASPKEESSKPEATAPAAEGKAEAAKSDASNKSDASKESGSRATPALRPDPAPPVTSAPPASPGTSTAVSSGMPEPTAAPAQSAPPVAPPAVTASVPPAAPAGPPVPPISK